MENQKLLNELERIKEQIESDNFTRENIDALIRKIEEERDSECEEELEAEMEAEQAEEAKRRAFETSRGV